MGPAAAAAEHDLSALPDDLRDGLLAATLRELARQLDEHNSLTSKSAAAAQVLALFDRLLELAPAEEDEDVVTDIQRRAAIGLARVPGAAS